MLIRVGIPVPYGKLPRHARTIGAPVMLSCNAFRRDGRWMTPGEALEGLDIALDSAGFVAMMRYGGFPWTINEYLSFVQRGEWAWYASMDLCCESEIAKNRQEVIRRIIETAHNYNRLCDMALNRNMAPPMPVLQGRLPDDYLWSFELLGEPTGLVGIGSVCRRPLNGEEGLLRIVDCLDRYLPKGVTFHLFGVKSTAIDALRSHPRVHSIDSMAWDYQARMEPGSNTMEKRCRHMEKWYGAQLERASKPGGAFQMSLL